MKNSDLTDTDDTAWVHPAQSCCVCVCSVFPSALPAACGVTNDEQKFRNEHKRSRYIHTNTHWTRQLAGGRGAPLRNISLNQMSQVSPLQTEIHAGLMTGFRIPDSEWFTVLSKVSSGPQTNDTDYAAVVIEHMLAWTQGTGQSLCALINWTQKQRRAAEESKSVRCKPICQDAPGSSCDCKINRNAREMIQRVRNKQTKAVNYMTRTSQRKREIQHLESSDWWTGIWNVYI